MTLIIFLLVLSILVLVHEFGHFIVAKLSKVKVEEFGIGFPPRFISIRYGETLYSINLLPFGGFVRLYGEEEKVTKEAGRAYSAKSKKVRASIIVAGVVMNFLLATVAFSAIYSFLGTPRKTDMVKVEGVIDNSPAQKIGLSIGDSILSVDGENVNTNEKFIALVDKKRGEEVTLQVKPLGGDTRNITVVPRKDIPDGEGPLGVVITDSERYFAPIWQRPFLGVWYGLGEAIAWGLTTIGSVFLVLATLFSSGSLPGGLAGPVGIYQITGDVAQHGLVALTRFLGILSVNLAILNILPIPALDGGRLLFVIIEAILGRRAKEAIPKIERFANMIGFALLITLLFAITLQDIKRIFGQ